MKTIRYPLVGFLVAMIWALLGTGMASGQLPSGAAAPVFSLNDLNGKVHDLNRLRASPITILYFFDVDSRPSQEGLMSLDLLAKQFQETSLAVWAVTLSGKGKVTDFVTRSGIGFPVLLDGGDVSKRYKADIVLPVVCIVGPDLKVLDYFQGGGKTTETMLVRVAERELQRKQTRSAKAISDEVIKKNPRNVKARTVKGYAALKEADLNEAENVFTDLSGQGAEGEILGKEGLAAVYARKRQTTKSLQLANEVEKKAPRRSYVHVVKGDLLYAMNKKKEAAEEYEKAVGKGETEPYLQPVGYNQRARIYANEGQYAKARELYDKAVAIDPYYIEGTTNKGVTYEKEGKWDKALESYRQALSLDEKDAFAAVLAKKAQEMLELQKDTERKKRVDQLVKDLAARYRSQQAAPPKSEQDPWTSGPMVLSFVDFQEKGGLSERDGLSTVLLAELSDHLNASGRVRVVERVLIERLLEELNLGSSELADSETALKLGNVLAAKLIGTGYLLYTPQETLLCLRMIDTETSAIPQMTNRVLGSQSSLDEEIFHLNREILKTVITKYPLRGYLVNVKGDQAIVNLGSKQGVVTGTKFDVIEEAESIIYKGKTLNASPKSIGRLEVVQVEPDLSHVRILKQERPVKADDKILERIEEAALR